MRNVTIPYWFCIVTMAASTNTPWFNFGFDIVARMAPESSLLQLRNTELPLHS
jgi:hypothetical protein